MSAEDSAAEKTEDASQRKKDQAKQRGNVAKSRDLSAAAVLFFAVIFLKYGGLYMIRGIINFIGTIFEEIPLMTIPPYGKDIVGYAPAWMMAFVSIIGPFLLVLFIIALVSGFSQVGFVFSAEALELKFDKLNPVAGAKRIFSLRSVITLIMSLGKVALVLTVAYYSFIGEFAAVRAMEGVSSGQVAENIVKAMLDLMLRLSAVLFVLALFDFWYQRFQWEKDLRMTKQEIKEEMRDTDGDPHVKGRRRQIQRQLAQQRMMAEVPQAEVVVRNPTHYAVAIGYDLERDEAPYVIAKGMDKLALNIIKTAEENDVPVKTEPQLARALYKLDIGDFIPQDLWGAVIEVLSWVYRGDKSKKLLKSLAS
ncbi:MAG: flagellar biosynthesis protein FlhB [Planctomycetota bacterium]|jgi:flagellar biosynthetic protein FlhB